MTRLNPTLNSAEGLLAAMEQGAETLRACRDRLSDSSEPPAGDKPGPGLKSLIFDYPLHLEEAAEWIEEALRKLHPALEIVREICDDLKEE